MSLPREWSLQTPAGCSLPSTNVLGRNDELADSYNLLNFAAENTGVDDNQNSLAGSLFSVHSAPVPELNVQTTTGTRPASLVISAEDTRSVDRALPCLLTPPDTADDEDNDNLLTISSLTARPLIAKSRELRCSKLSSHKNKKRPRRIKPAAADPEDRIEPPDGGYGWIVVCGAFFVQFWVAGLVKSYGVLFVEIMEAYSDSSASVASWIPAILSALCLALAPLSSALCQKFSCRIVVFTGGLFCALGLTLSYFATRLIHLFFTFGVLTGIGGGLSTTPGIVMVSQYFDKHRALANGICISGTAAGSFVFPLLIEHLCDTFGFHGTILLLGGCMLHVCVSAMLYRPIKPTPAPQLIKPEQPTGTELESIPANKKLEFLFVNQPNTISAKTMNAKVGNNLLSELFNQNAILIDPLKVSDSEEEKDQIGETILIKRICSFRSSSILHSVEDLSTDSTCVYKSRHREPLSRSMFLVPTPPAQLTQKDDMLVNDLKDGEVKKSKKTCLQKISQYLDLSLLKDGKFIMMCLSVTLMSTGSPYMLYYLPVYVISTGYTKSEAGYLVAISAALDLCGRLGLGWLSDLQLFDRRKGYIGSMVGAGVAVLVIPVADSFYVLACSVGMYGLCLGCWFLLVPVLLADQYGTDKISSSYGLVRMFQSVGAITVPPLAGYIRDVTGGYEYCFYCMGTCMVLGGVPLLLVSGFPCFVNESDVENGSQTDQNTTEK